MSFVFLKTLGMGISEVGCARGVSEFRVALVGELPFRRSELPRKNAFLSSDLPFYRDFPLSEAKSGGISEFRVPLFSRTCPFRGQNCRARMHF